MFSGDQNGKIRLVRFSEDHEKVAAVHDAAAACGCPEVLLDELQQMLGGEEFDDDIATESVYSVIFASPRLREILEDRDLTADEMVDWIYSREDPTAICA